MQTSISIKNQELTKANGIIDVYKLRLTNLEKSLVGAKEREKVLSADLENEKALLKSPADSFNELKGSYCRISGSANP